ncbi:GntR family transcriptional regulator [Frondihabitans sucicola]|uniref:GntR family transcriptional regulator n=1 Tax=Frondihabitans sucicola TaxID=1268041 RepID=A0ABN6Y4A5_9MICO|nr:GntR family transcriptional regulator [Frondihabitans sucicola]BDZ52033.1 GntR family transcriptional regulator [Frondihabitans sucicola]
MQIIVSTTSGVPLYEQIKTQVRAAIHGGDLRDGALLPSLRQLAAQLRVSIITVTRAYNDLVAEGLVANEHGRGFAVLPVDRAVATAALQERVDRGIDEVVTAARAAQVSRDDLLRRVERQWNQE